jgi:hypothetical protein
MRTGGLIFRLKRPAVRQTCQGAHKTVEGRQHTGVIVHLYCDAVRLTRDQRYGRFGGQSKPNVQKTVRDMIVPLVAVSNRPLHENNC